MNCVRELPVSPRSPEGDSNFADTLLLEEDHEEEMLHEEGEVEEAHVSFTERIKEFVLLEVIFQWRWQ